MKTKVFLKKYAKKISIKNQILIFIFLVVCFIIGPSTFAERDYYSCVVENRDKTYDEFCDEQNEEGKGINGDKIICQLPYEEKEKLSKVKDGCCAAETLCNSPREFILYENFVKEVLAVINPSLKEPDEEQIIFGLFSSKVLNLGMSNTTVLQGLAKGYLQNVNQKAQTLLSTSIILGSVATEFVTKDGPSFFTMLLQSPQIFSDYVKIQKLDAMIHDTVFELGLNGSYLSKIDEKSYQKIDEILKKYQGTGLFDTQTIILPEVRVEKVITMLMKGNSSMKSLISLGSIDGFYFKDRQENKTFGNWRKDKGISLEFNNTAIWTMKYKYNCARGTFQCSAGLENFKKNMKSITQDAGKGGKDSMAIIKDANNRFRYFMFGGKKLDGKEKSDAMQDVNEAYSSIGIINSLNELTTMSGKKTALVEQIKEVSTDISKRTNDFKQTIKTKITEEKEKEKNLKDRVDEFKENHENIALWGTFFGNIGKNTSNLIDKINKNPGQYKLTEQELQSYKDYLKTIVEEVFQEQELYKLDKVTTDTKTILANFTLILNQIDKINATIGKDKNDTSSTIVKNLGDVCERQCEKSKGKCYAK